MTASPDCANIIQNRSYLGAIKQYPLFHGKAKSYLFQHLNLLKSFLEMICYKVNYIPNFLSNSFCRAEAKPRHLKKRKLLDKQFLFFYSSMSANKATIFKSLPQICVFCLRGGHGGHEKQAPWDQREI